MSILDRAELEKLSRELAQDLKEAMPPGIGFVLGVFEYGGPGKWLSYISSARRDDTIRVLRELLSELEERTTEGHAH